MAKFVAKQAVDMTDLEELEFLIDPLDVDYLHRERDGFVAKSGDERVEVDGSGFRYALQVPLPVGTIRRIEVSESGDLEYKFTDLDFDLDDVIGADGVDEVVLDMLSGDDTVKGSFGGDILTGGKGDDNVRGKSGDDELHGEKGKDLLGGGDDSDTLNGGSGKDTYLFKDAPGNGIDTIAKFESGETIEVKAKAFSGLSEGQLASGQFVVGTQAADGDDRFIYDQATGSLYHDADGAGGATQNQFAQLDANLDHFGAGNILVV